MADTDPVNFTMGAARQVRESVRVTQRIAHNERGRGRKWPIPEDGGGSGAEIISFEIIDVVRGIGFLCNAMECTVVGVNCNLQDPVVGDTVIVWDGPTCSFNLPFELLYLQRGYAVRMTTPADYFSDGGLESERPCRWEVLRMCCSEEGT